MASTSELPWQQGVWPLIFGKKFQRPLVVPNPCYFEPSKPQSKKRAVSMADTWQEPVSNLDVETWQNARNALL